MLTVKCGRNEFRLTVADEVVFNGACYQITTKKVMAGWGYRIPIIAKKKAEKLIKSGQLVLKRKDRDTEIYKIP